MVSTEIQRLFEETEDVPECATVCHYDELAEPTKESLPGLIDAETEQETATHLDSIITEDLTRCDYIKFTTFYRVNC